MKKQIVACLAALAIAGTAVAQAGPAQQAPAAAAQQLVKLSGKLEVINGMIGLKADGTSYLLPHLGQLVGFVKELQEGASVKVEGYAYPVPSQAGYSMLALTKLTIGGKDYDFGKADGFGPFGGRGMGYGAGGGRGGRGMMGGRMGGNGPRW
jgi:hypothetical protein